MILSRKTFFQSINFVSCVTVTTLSMSLVACSGSKGLGSKDGSASPTAVLEKASSSLKIEKVNGINVISKASIESYLYDLKNNATSQAAKSFKVMRESSAVDYAMQSWSEVTNEPLEVMGYRFENLVDWSTALEEQIQTGLSEFSTMGEYLKSGGINSANDLELESIEDSLLAAEEFFAQDPVAWMQENQVGKGQNGLALQQDQDKSLVGDHNCPLLPPTNPFAKPKGKGRDQGKTDPSIWTEDGDGGGGGGTWLVESAEPESEVRKGSTLPHNWPCGIM